MTGHDRLRITVGDDDGLVLDVLPDAEEPDAQAWVQHLPVRALDRAEGRLRFEVLVDGWRFEVAVEHARMATLRERARRGADEQRPHPREVVRAQIPGRIVAVHVASGDRVEAGARLLSIEAMKMENEVRTARPGTIGAVAVSAGDRVELGDELVVVE
jgi:biotin carboxyl carrier protein